MDSRTFQNSDPIMTPEVESQLKEPFGELIEGPEEDITVAALEAISIDRSTKFSGPLIAVGDVTVLAFQNSGRPADIAIVDGQTKRENGRARMKLTSVCMIISRMY